MSYFTLVCLWCGRAGGRTVTWLPKCLRWVDYHIFLGMGLSSRARGAPAIKKAQAECWASLAWTVRFKSNQLRSTDEISSSCTPANKLKAGHLFTQVVRKKFRANLTYNLLECRIQTKQICRTIDVLRLQHSVDCLWALTVLEKLQERVTKANNKHRMWISRRP